MAQFEEGQILWNGARVSKQLADAYNAIDQRIQDILDAGEQPPEELLNDRHKLINFPNKRPPVTVH